MPFIRHTYRLKEPMPAFLFLMRRLGVRQGEAQKIVGTGRLFMEGRQVENSGARICGHIEVTLFSPSPRGRRPIFETPDFALFDKPSGVLVHPTTYRTPYSMLDEIRALYGADANAIHRIDMETSGLLLASRHKAAEQRLKVMFENRRIRKSYLAWVRGRIDTAFEVDAPLRRNDDFRTIKLKMLVHPEGKPAHTRFEPLAYDEALDATLLRILPLTGRQHQIRVHLFHVKHPILGDPIYGVEMDVAMRYLDKVLDEEARRYYMGASRLMLHAQSLDFVYRGVRYVLESKEDFYAMRHLITPPSNRAAPVG